MIKKGGRKIKKKNDGPNLTVCCVIRVARVVSSLKGGGEEKKEETLLSDQS